MSDFPGDAKAWADHHNAFSNSASDVFHRVMGAFGALHRAQYDAPWRASGKRRAR